MEKAKEANTEEKIKEEVEAKNAEATSEDQTQETINSDEANGEESSSDGTGANELGEMKEKYLRLYSEFDNFRKRTSKEKLDLISTANEKLIVDLLPVADDFERALKSFETAEDIEAVKEGFTLIMDKFFKTLTNAGLKPIDAQGKDFDADLHEGITQIPAPEESLKGKVVDEVEKGYYLGEKVVRYSKVVIGQ